MSRALSGSPLDWSISRKRAERQGEGLAGLAVLHRHHVQAAAAQIGDQAVGVGNARHHAFGGDARFVLARQHADRRAPGAFGPARRIPRHWRRRAPPPSPPPRAAPRPARRRSGGSGPAPPAPRRSLRHAAGRSRPCRGRCRRWLFHSAGWRRRGSGSHRSPGAPNWSRYRRWRPAPRALAAARGWDAAVCRSVDGRHKFSSGSWRGASAS